MSLSVYAIPATVALLGKIAVFLYARHSRVHNLQTQLCLLFLFCMALQNVAEISFFLTNAQGADHVQYTTGKIWYTALILGIALLLHLAFVTATNQRAPDGNLPRWGLVFLYAPVFALETILWLKTWWLIEGFRSMGYTITKIPGPLYPLVEIQFIGYLCAALALFAYGARRQSTSQRRLRNKLMLVGFAPFAMLVVVVVVLLHLGYRGFNVTATGPIALTFFVAVMAYATHQYRLFDIEFYLPWSTVRRRKTAFYKRIQATIAEVADLRSVSGILDLIVRALQCQVAFVGGPRPVVASENAKYSVGRESLTFAEFPLNALRSIDGIVVANEIADKNPSLHRTMKRHKVGAIVPFSSRGGTETHWLLLGEHFSDQVYTPLDFKMVETLFDRIGERFLDNMLLLRSQLAEANEELRDYQRRLGMAWSELESLRKNLDATERDNRTLREEKANLMRQQFRVVAGGLPSAIESGEKTLEQYLADWEREIVRAALRDSRGNKANAARLLGVQLRTLHDLIQRHDLEQDEIT